MIYLDNAATSYEKPECVYRAADRALREFSANPGRSGHKKSLEADNIIMTTRRLCAKLFNCENSDSIVFCSNCTEALNVAIHGIMMGGGLVICSQMEHNSVVRPLEYLRKYGVETIKAATDPEFGVDARDVRRHIKNDTKLVIINHVSNVTGTVNDVAAIGRVCREAGVPLLVDAAQSAGILPIDVQEMNIDFLAFPGHKGLLGPQGTGGLYINGSLLPEPLKQGGTGSRSESTAQPEIMPDRFESGTLNVPGIAGLGAGIEYIMEKGIENIGSRECDFANMLADGISQIPGMTVYSSHAAMGPVVSVSCDAIDPQDFAVMLDQVFGIAVRSGLHCAPDAHKCIGTFDIGGTVRFSPGHFTTEADIKRCIEAVEMIASGKV